MVFKGGTIYCLAFYRKSLLNSESNTLISQIRKVTSLKPVNAKVKTSLQVSRFPGWFSFHCNPTAPLVLENWYCYTFEGSFSMAHVLLPCLVFFCFQHKMVLSFQSLNGMNDYSCAWNLGQCTTYHSFIHSIMK